MQALARKTYGEVHHRTACERNLEHALFQQITDGLDTVAAMAAPPSSLWADAINRNLELWTLMATDLQHADNRLPGDLKARLIRLHDYVRRTSHQVLAGSGELVSLIEVNRSVMAGLVPDGVS